MLSLTRAEGPNRVASLAGYVRAVASQTPGALIAPSSFVAIERVASLLPAAISNHLVFECRLGIEEGTSDFSVGSSIAEGGRAILSGKHSGIPKPPILDEHPGWARVRSFCDEWGDPASPLHAGADYFWLEFDVANPAVTDPVPNTFFEPRHGDWLGGDAEASDARAQLARSVVERGIGLLSGQPLSPSAVDALHCSFSLLPDQAWLYQLGVMSARDPAPVRMQFSHVSPASFLAFLNRAGWGGSMEALAEVVADMSRLTDDITFAFDWDGGIGPKIGLECYVRDDPRSPSDVRWPMFLDHLVARGLCLPAKRQALFDYPGAMREHAHPEHWPANLSQASRLFGEGLTPVLSRYLNHLKVVFLDGEAIEAKAYPAVSLRWMVRRA